MKIIIASDSYKNTLSTFEVNDIIASAALDVFDNIKVSKIPIADGGENTLDVLDYFLNFKKINVESVDENLKPINTYYGTFDNIAIIESAKVIGLKDNPKNILNKSSYGVGLLIKDALEKNIKTIYLALGGSSTNDAGIGALSALGIKFLDKNNKELEAKIKNIDKIIDVNTDEVELNDVSINIISDVNNPFIGEFGASYTYAKQKGANKKEIEYLESLLSHLNDLFISKYNINLINTIGSGAAGGISGSFYAILNAKILNGIDTVLELINFKEKALNSNLIISGEGSIDNQSLHNKTIIGIAKIAKEINVPLITIGGSSSVSINTLNKYNISANFSTISNITSLDTALLNAKENLYETSLNIFKLIKLANQI